MVRRALAGRPIFWRSWLGGSRRLPDRVRRAEPFVRAPPGRDGASERDRHGQRALLGLRRARRKPARRPDAARSTLVACDSPRARARAAGGIAVAALQARGRRAPA